MSTVTEYPHQAPGLCFICEQNPEGLWIDTFRNFETGGPTKLTGRKYVCEHCAAEFANDMGFLSPVKVAELQAELDAKVAELADTGTKLAHYEAYHAASTAIKELHVSDTPVEQSESVAPAKPRGRPRKVAG